MAELDVVLCDAALIGQGDPTGVVLPSYPGCLFRDILNAILYMATGETENDWTQVGGGAAPALSLLGTFTPTGTPKVITCSAIPQTATDLIVALSLRTDAAAASDTCAVQFNTDTGANYDAVSGHLAGAAGFVETGHSYADTRSIFTIDVPGASANAQDWSEHELTLQNYSSTTKRKFAWIDGGDFDDTDIFRTVSGVHWRSAAALTSIKIFSTPGNNIVAGSNARVYGRV